MEIEKKFTVKRLPKDLGQYECKDIEQGYLCTNPVVRVRKSDDQYILTYKSPCPKESQTHDVKVNHELEAELSEEGYEHLKQKKDGHLVRKNRYILPLESGLNIELDVFKGRLEGLAIAEVEFPDLEAVEAFLPPDWFDRDVSNDSRYNNFFLATLNEWMGMES